MPPAADDDAVKDIGGGVVVALCDRDVLLELVDRDAALECGRELFLIGVGGESRIDRVACQLLDHEGVRSATATMN